MVAPTMCFLYFVRAIHESPVLFAICVCFFGAAGASPRPTVQNLHTINFLSDQGLGGPWELARAKARLHLAPTVCWCIANLF